MPIRPPERIRVIDSHTEGEPTRVVIDGGPDLCGGSLADQARVFKERFDHLRSAIVCEPRGSDPVVGALLCKPVNPRAAAGVVFFNNVGLLNMCGHGMMGLIVTLAYLGRIGVGTHLIETTVGDVTATLEGDGAVTVANVASYRLHKGLRLVVPGVGPVHGDVAWGGNWFFLCEDHGQRLTLDNMDALTAVSWAIRQELARCGIKGDDGREIDHVELFGPPTCAGSHSRNFVLCPGKAYDRSPCGTGTSAKVACLAADGKLKPGDVWRQESIIGSTFCAGYACGEAGRVLPTITGRAYVTAEATLLLDPHDPFVHGIRS